MRTARRGRRGAPVDEDEEEDIGYVNPMAQPPAIGLTLGEGGSLPKLLFHTQLLPSSKVHRANYMYMYDEELIDTRGLLFFPVSSDTFSNSNFLHISEFSSAQVCSLSKLLFLCPKIHWF